ncbi:CvpA family protein [Xanthomonadaceae bacterium JHOS43]|nr:CvpA family protein [Xanthomonadaceae bacterium JHOS43]MCX7564455.1 CvpA family protein [Xanthomonadaceae bacterium XH05]
MLTWLDIVLLAILGLSAVVGLWRGFISEVMSLAVWVAAFWLAFVFGLTVAGLFEAHVDAPTARWLLGYAAVFLLALVVGGLLTWLIGKLVKSTGLSGTDRVLGLGFGLLRGAAVACALVLVAGFTPLPQEAAWRDSRVVPGFERGAEWMKGWLPEALAERLSFDPMQAIPLLPAIPGDNDAPVAPVEADRPPSDAPSDTSPPAQRRRDS